MKKRTLAVAAIAVAVLAACGGGKSSGGSSPGPAAHAALPSCGGQSPVWALRGTRVYLLPGDRLYGKTKHGEYLCLSDARAKGLRPGRHPLRQHAHRQRPHRPKVFSV